MTDCAFFLTFWVLGLLVSCGITHMWFQSTFPVELAIILRNIGLIKNAASQAMMPVTGMLSPKSLEEFVRSDFDRWLIRLEQANMLNRRCAHIMACPVCLSVHVSLWTGAAMMITQHAVWPAPPGAGLAAWFWLFSALSWVVPIARLSKPATSNTKAA